MKPIAVIFTIACVLATMDYLGCKYDLEPGEPGFDTYGGLGALCMLIAFPVMLARCCLWTLISMILSHSIDWIRSDSNYPLVWLTDLTIVFGVAGITHGLRTLLRR